MDKEQPRIDYIFQFTQNTGWRKEMNEILKVWVSSTNAELFEKVNGFLNKIKNKEYKNELTDFPYDTLIEWAENSLLWLKHLIEREKSGEPNIDGLDEFVKTGSRAGEAFMRLQECYKPEIIYLNENTN